MPVKSKHSWRAISIAGNAWPLGYDNGAATDTPSSCSDFELVENISTASDFELVDSDDSRSAWSQRIQSDALAMLALAPASAGTKVLHVELGQHDRTKEAELDIVIGNLSVSGVTVLKSVGDRQHTIWKVRSVSATEPRPPRWRYRPKKPTEVIIPPNPNTIKDNEPPRKTRRWIRRKFERSMVTTNDEFCRWKRCAGRSKSWKHSRHNHIKEWKNRTSNRSSERFQRFSTSPWLFSAYTVSLSYLRAHGIKPAPNRRKKSSHRRRVKETYTKDINLRGKKTQERAQRIRWHSGVRVCGSATLLVAGGQSDFQKMHEMNTAYQ